MYASLHLKLNSHVFNGVDFSTYDELIAATHTTEQICEVIGADSLAFISVDGLTKGVDAVQNSEKTADNASLVLTAITQPIYMKM